VSSARALLGAVWSVYRQMATEYVDGSEKAPLSGGGVGRRAVPPSSKPDWTRFGLGDDTQRATATRPDDDAAGEVNEIYAEHEVPASSHVTASIMPALTFFHTGSGTARRCTVSHPV